MYSGADSAASQAFRARISLHGSPLLVQVGLPAEPLVPISARVMRLDLSGAGAKLHSRAIMVVVRQQREQHCSQRHTELILASTDASQHSAFLREIPSLEIPPLRNRGSSRRVLEDSSIFLRGLRSIGLILTTRLRWLVLRRMEEQSFGLLQAKFQRSSTPRTAGAQAPSRAQS